MVRSFTGEAVSGELLTELATEALRSPTAGNSAGVYFTILEGGQVARYFEIATDQPWRDRNIRAAGLLRAGAVILVTCDAQAYVRRYADHDKIGSGLDDVDGWPIPYWLTDAAMATMSLLLLLQEAELAATIWGNFRDDRGVLALGEVPEEHQLFATVIVGHSDGLDHRSASLDRPTPSRASRVRRLT